jgi:hypothetical protein
MEHNMKKIILALSLAASAIAFLPTEAGAVVCGVGLYHAGCTGWHRPGIGAHIGPIGAGVGVHGVGAHVGPVGVGIGVRHHCWINRYGHRVCN